MTFETLLVLENGLGIGQEGASGEFIVARQGKMLGNAATEAGNEDTRCN